MGQFWSLADSKIIDVKPDRLAIRTTSSHGSLRQSPQRFGVPQEKGEAPAILNGMKLDDPSQKRTC